LYADAQCSTLFGIQYIFTSGCQDIPLASASVYYKCSENSTLYVQYYSGLGCTLGNEALYFTFNDSDCSYSGDIYTSKKLCYIGSYANLDAVIEGNGAIYKSL
jgi:hypothetical protein